MRVQPLLARDCPEISQPVVRGWRWRLATRVDQASWRSLMSCPPLVLHAERGGSIVETGYAQKNDFRPFGNFSQGLCDLLGFGTLLGPPVKVGRPLVFSAFESSSPTRLIRSLRIASNASVFLTQTMIENLGSRNMPLTPFTVRLRCEPHSLEFGPYPPESATHQAALWAHFFR